MVQRPEPTLIPGSPIGPYRIERTLGGGFDNVAYLAQRGAPETRCLIREFKPSGIAVRAANGRDIELTHEEDRALFQRGLAEVRHLAEQFKSFRHVNVAALLDCIDANGTCYLVQEAIDGKSLDRILGAGEALDPAELEEILPGLLAGLTGIHDAGLLHLDLCPESLFIRKNGLLVLGRSSLIRRRLSTGDRDRALDPRDAYRSEEYFTVNGKFGTWSDIYSLGATLYRLVTGAPPLDAPERRRRIAAGQFDPVGPALDALVGAWPKTVLTAIRHGMGVSASGRPRGVTAFRVALDAATASDLPTVPVRATAQPPYESDEAPTVRFERGRALNASPAPPRTPPVSEIPRTPSVLGQRAQRVEEMTEPSADSGGKTQPGAPRVPGRPISLSGPAPDDAETVRHAPRRADALSPPTVPPAGAPARAGKGAALVYRQGKAEIVSPPAAARGGTTAEPDVLPQPARITTYQPMTVPPGRWLDLNIYLHEPGIDSVVRQDFEARLSARPPIEPKPRAEVAFCVKPGGAVTIVPYLPGCRTNPTSLTVEWWENFHRFPFRLIAAEGVPGFARTAITGTVGVFVGAVLIGEIRINYTIADEEVEPITNTISSATDSFDAVYPAFAAEDGEIAARLDAANRQLENPFLSEALAARAAGNAADGFKQIENAERFQIFWSSAAIASKNLEEEWRFALGLGRDNFLSAFAWRYPVPDLPAALDDVALRHLVLPLE